MPNTDKQSGSRIMTPSEAPSQLSKTEKADSDKSSGRHAYLQLFTCPPRNLYYAEAVAKPDSPSYRHKKDSFSPSALEFDLQFGRSSQWISAADKNTCREFSAKPYYYNMCPIPQSPQPNRGQIKSEDEVSDDVMSGYEAEADSIDVKEMKLSKAAREWVLAKRAVVRGLRDARRERERSRMRGQAENKQTAKSTRPISDDLGGEQKH